jgi:Methyltransferase domain
VDEPTGALRTLQAERDALKQRCERLDTLLGNVSYPPGHFYSPIVDVSDHHAIAAVRTRVDAPPPAGIKIDAPAMTLMMQRLAEHHPLFPFPRQQEAGYRFYFDNPFFGCYDASVLFSMLLEFRPRRVIEVGCGHSSCLLLDTSERFFDDALDLTLIDPFPENLKQLLGNRGTSNARLLRVPVQDVPRETFEQLEENDILFLDSSHVSKTGSDVNYLLFEILPALKPGVLVHIHDILYPFEYPEEWVLKEKRSWNESYLLRAFLQYNSAFEIVYWNNFAWHRMHEDLGRLMPLCLENEGGSIWLRRER